MVRRLAALLALIALLAACGSTTVPVAPTSAPLPTSGPSASSGSSSVVDATRVVTDGAGNSVTIPREPQRIVALHDLDVTYALASLGVRLAGTADIEGSTPLSRIAALGPLPPSLEGVPLVGAVPSPNLEAIAALQPDLIIGTVAGHSDEYEALAQIAPTFLIDQQAGDDTVANQRLLAELAGVTDVLEARLTAYEERVARLQAEHAALWSQLEFTRIDTYGVDSNYLINGFALAPGFQVLQDLGARQSNTVRGFDEPFPQISLEVMPTFDADVILLGVEAGSPAAPEVREILSNTFAGRAGQIFEVDYGRWGFRNVDALHQVLDDVERLLLSGPIDTSGAFRSDAAEPTGATAAYPRTITDGAGQQVTLAAPPQRIAVLDPLTSLEALLALGVAPVQIGQRSFVADYLGDPLKQWPWLEMALAEAGADPERINADQTNLEAVAGARPDLIIGQSFWVDEQRELLSQVAPTLTTPLADVRAAITLLGEALALEERAAQVLADWDARLATEVEGLVTPGTTVAIIRTDGEGTFTIFNTAGYGPYDMLTRAGFSVPESLAAAPKNAYGLGSDFSLERLNVLDAADVIVVLGFSVDATDELLANPLFTRVPAAAAGRVVRVEQGPVAQALAIQSPLNLDTVLPVIREAAALAP